MKHADLAVPFTREALRAFICDYKNAPGTLGAVLEDVFVALEGAEERERYHLQSDANLRAENERWRTALQTIAGLFAPPGERIVTAVAIARAALAGEKEPT
jgi:hypothetical protein